MCTTVRGVEAEVGGPSGYEGDEPRGDPPRSRHRNLGDTALTRMRRAEDATTHQVQGQSIGDPLHSPAGEFVEGLPDARSVATGGKQEAQQDPGLQPVEEP